MANERNGRSGAGDPGARGRGTGREPLALSRRMEGPARSEPTPPLRYGTLFGGALPSRERVLSTASLGALALGVLLLALAAPWSPLTDEADAQVSGTFNSSSAEATTGTGGGTEGGFAPSVLPEDAPAVKSESAAALAESSPTEETSSESTGQLPEAAPGGSTADDRHGETTEAGGSSATATSAATTSATASAAAGSTCTDYSTQGEAQAALDAGEYGLDEDGDAEACEAYFGTGTYDNVSPAGLETGGMPSAAVWAKMAGVALTAVGLGGLGLVFAGRLFPRWRLL